MTTIQFYPGDKCWALVNGKKHYGICTGNGPDQELWFIHNVKNGGVIHTTRKGFAGHREIELEQRALPEHREAVVQRAKNLIGEQYNLFLFNCEHVANLASNGKKESRQLQRAGVVTSVVAAGATLIGVIISEMDDGTWVDDNGYRRDSLGRFTSRK